MSALGWLLAGGVAAALLADSSDPVDTKHVDIEVIGRSLDTYTKTFRIDQIVDLSSCYDKSLDSYLAVIKMKTGTVYYSYENVDNIVDRIKTILEYGEGK